MDKKMAKAEQGLDEYSSSNPAKAEEIKKEKIAVALTYGTASATVPASFASPATLACPAEQSTNSPRIHTPGPAAACRGPEPVPSAGPLSDQASPSPRSPVLKKYVEGDLPSLSAEVHCD